MNNRLIAGLKTEAANALQTTAIAIALMLTTIPAFALAATQCVLPVADGGDIAPSPPSVAGTIVKIRDHQLTVQTKAGVFTALSSTMALACGRSMAAVSRRPTSRWGSTH